MRLLFLLTGCTLGVVGSSPDANGLGITPFDLEDPADQSQISDAAMAMDSQLAAADLGASDLASVPDLAARRVSPIAIENQKPGSTGWKLTAASFGIAGYATHQSYAPGDTVDVCAGGDSSLTWELWRLGWYGGTGGRKISGGGPVAVAPAASPTLDSSTGMVRAPWPVAFSVALPADAVTGFYVIKLSAAHSQSYVPLIVRGDGAPTVWPVPFNTYQAYNAWGGTGLYNNNRSDWKPWHAYAVSFDRPYSQGNGAGQLFFADRDFINFAEAQGYDLDYAVESDIDADPQLLERSLIVLQGHSEYWSAPERNALEAAVANGSHLVVFGANDVFWQVRYDPTRRVMTGYKEFANLDPDQAHETTQWRNLGRPENALLGVMFGEWLWSSVPFRIDDPSLWIWSGAKVSAGSLVPGLYGFEIDRRYDNGAEPPGLLEVGSGLAENHSAELARGQATLYTAASGATVFASGTVSWSQALGWSAPVQQATHNLFARLAGESGPLVPLHTGGPTAPDYVPGVSVSTISAALDSPVAVTVAPDGSAVVADGDQIVRVTMGGVVSVIASGFAGPRGVAVAADGTIYVADTGNHQIKKIVGGVVTTFAGSTEGYAEGKPGKLDLPTSIALLPSGTLLVSDVWNMRVRAIAADGTISTRAGNGVEASNSTSLYFPFALAAHPDGTALVAESNDGMIRQVAANGTLGDFAGQLGRTGWNDGPLDQASVSELMGLAVRGDGAVAVLDAASYRVRIIENGAVRTLAGGSTSALVDGAGADAGFSLPRAAAFAADGSLLVADTGNHALRRITGSTF